MDRIAELQKTHLGLRLHVAIWALAPNVAPADLMPMLAEHLEFLHDLEQRGILFASGPLFDSDEAAPPGGGLSFFRADSMDAARALIETEPFVKAGLRTYTLKRWTFNEGSISIRLNAGIGTYEIS
jgi:uncharacterized protein YciI